MRTRTTGRAATLLLLAGAAACGDGSSVRDDEASDNATVGSESFSLTVTQEDGTRVELVDYQVSCEPRFYDGATPTGDIIEVATPVDAIGPNRHGYFYVQAVVADVADGASYDFGFDFGFVYDHPSGADIVVGIGKGEPFTGAEELSRGTITIHSATCSPKPAIDLEVKGTLANEYETEGSVEIDGRMNVGG